MRSFLYLLSLLSLVGSFSSCKTVKWSNFNKQKFTHLKQVDQIEENYQIAPKEEVEHNDHYKYAPLSEVNDEVSEFQMESEPDAQIIQTDLANETSPTNSIIENKKLEYENPKTHIKSKSGRPTINWFSIALFLGFVGIALLIGLGIVLLFVGAHYGILLGAVFIILGGVLILFLIRWRANGKLMSKESRNGFSKGILEIFFGLSLASSIGLFFLIYAGLYLIGGLVILLGLLLVVLGIMNIKKNKPRQYSNPLIKNKFWRTFILTLIILLGVTGIVLFGIDFAS